MQVQPNIQKRTRDANADAGLTRCETCDEVLGTVDAASHKCPKRARAPPEEKNEPCPPLPEGHVPRKCGNSSCARVSTHENRHLFYRVSPRNYPKHSYSKGQFAFMLTCNRCNAHFANRTDEQRARYRNRGREYAETRRGFLGTVFDNMQQRSRVLLAPPPGFAGLDGFVEWCAQYTCCTSCGIPLVFARTDPESLQRQASPDRNVNEAEARERRANGDPDFQCCYQPGDFVLNCRFCQFARNESSIAQMQDWIATVLFGHPAPEHPSNPNWASRAIGNPNTSAKDS
jgi:hypothetical protein